MKMFWSIFKDEPALWVVAGLFACMIASIVTNLVQGTIPHPFG